jgi:hypothetical protein
MSLAAHLSALILAALLIRNRPPEAIEEADRAATIVLASRSPAKTEYFAEAASASAERHEVLRPAAEAAAAGGSSLPSPEPPPAIVGMALPELPGALPPGEGLVVAAEANAGRSRGRVLPPGIDDAAILAEDALIPREYVPTGPTARLSLFGSAQAEGRSFVFVIDRSKSMGGGGLGAIEAAAKELEAQIGRLTEQQTFQVVAYNQSAAFLGERKLIAASEPNKERLIDFVKNLAAFGQTEHYHGLLAALRLKPEVIFLLTDAGDPHPGAGQLRAIREQAGGRTSIHCLQFGSGPLSESNNFLARLAAENRGSYAYIDMGGR